MGAYYSGLASMAWAQLWQVTVVALAIGALAWLVGRRRPHLAYALLAVGNREMSNTAHLEQSFGHLQLGWRMGGRAARNRYPAGTFYVAPTADRGKNAGG